MRIPWEVIIEALEAYAPQAIVTFPGAAYSKVQLFRAAELASEGDTLYVGRGSNMHSPARTKCGFICLGKPLADQEQMVVLPDTCNLYEVFNRLEELFARLSGYEAELMRAANTVTYQQMIDIGYRIMGNPLVLLDNGFRVHAMTDVDIPSDREWQHLRTEGNSSPELLYALKEKGRLFAEAAGRTFSFSAPHSPYHNLIQRTYVGGKIAGSVVVVEVFKPFSSVDKLLFPLLIEAVEMKMSRDDGFRSVGANGPVYSMLDALLQGLRFDPALIAATFRQYRPGWTHGCFRVLFVPLGDIDDRTFGFYANLLEKDFDCLSVLLKGALVSVLHYESRDRCETFKTSLAGFLARHSLHGGMSAELDKLSELDYFYSQAVVGLELSGGTRFLHPYREVALRHILSFVSKETRPVVRHPFLLRLKEFDEKNRTELLKTLHAYLRNERSLAKTARTLHIHRNTLLYRINKIAEVVPLDLEDEDTRLHLLISYRI